MTAGHGPAGPYRCERDAAAAAMPRAVRALHDAGRVRAGDPERLVRDTIAGHLLHACEDTGMELGDYDRRVLVWLSRGEPATAQVLIGLISRAYQAGVQAAESRSDSRAGDHGRAWLAESAPGLLPTVARPAYADRCPDGGPHLWVGRDGRPASGDDTDRCDACGARRTTENPAARSDSR
ncbi:hypothetical protein [Mangrovihabitans endophyticus]|uniref:Uncharacterized protein n=1 Tax=Mangrovihabitans endophyticus TaxID=1751298 RepID=A0A8J3BZM4_9ACTN|nr:hypothetical protein [Mangrovihabitans endophyticus]GGK89456.1 hypothetical protein GCM10012284_24280 [Mangrovihabitans endophyticus]